MVLLLNPPAPKVVKDAARATEVSIQALFSGHREFAYLCHPVLSL